MRFRFATATLLFWLAVATPPVGAEVYRVDPGAVPGGDGSSWNGALGNFLEALSVIRSGDEIWLKRGVYRTPQVIADANSAPYSGQFPVTVPVTIRGGFLGTELSPDQRPLVDPADTILSGDRLGDDGSVALSNPDDNATVVLRVDVRKRGRVLLEGVTIEGAARVAGDVGGGIVATGRGVAELVVENCVVHRNGTEELGTSGISAAKLGLVCRHSVIGPNTGGGIVAGTSHVKLEDVLVSGNGSSGVTVTAQGNRDISLIECRIVNNGVHGLSMNGCRMSVRNSEFSNNGLNGAVIGYPPASYISVSGGGTVRVVSPTTTASLSNCVFSGNAVAGARCESPFGDYVFVGCSFEQNQTGLLSTTGCRVAMDECGFSHNLMGLTGVDGTEISGRNVVFSENGPNVFAAGVHLVSGGSWEGTTVELANAVFQGNDGTALTIEPASDQANMHRVTLVNPVFVGNVLSGGPGGAIRNSGQLSIHQGTFVENEALAYGDAIARTEPRGLLPETTVTQSIFWRNDASGSDPVSVPLTSESQGNLSTADPMFMREPDSGDGDWTTFGDNDYGDLRPQQDSPAANAGRTALLLLDFLDIDGDGNTTELLPLDAAGERRVESGRPDIGAFESERVAFTTGTPPRPPIVFSGNAWGDEYAGYWSGMVWSDSSRTQPVGTVRKMVIRLSRRPDDANTAQTTVAVEVQGRKYRFRGRFDAEGVFSENLELKVRGAGGDTDVVTASLELQTGSADGTRSLSGIFSIGPIDYSVSLVPSSFHRRKHPVVDEVGRYTTLLMPGALWTTADPAGVGAGTVVLKSSGQVRMKGYLADGQLFSWGGRLSDDRSIYLWKNLRGGNPGGFLAGRIRVREFASVSDMDGFLVWSKAANGKAKHFAAGFQLEADFVASRYDRYRGQRILPGVLDDEVNAVLSIDLAGEPEAGIDQGNVNWTRKNVIRSPEAGHQLRLRGKTTSGLFSGSFRTEAGETIKLKAVAFQKQGLVLGNALGNSGSQGVVEIYPEDRP